MSEENKCDVCLKLSSLKCGGCHNVYYCSKEHQKIGWKKHKKSCRPFKICEDDDFGRHLIATRNIKPGETILKEPVVIWGPSQMTVPVCLGCGKSVNEKNSRPCSKCGWPVCSDICEKAPGHIPECRYTVLRGDKVSIKNFDMVHPTYQCITVLRCLYQKQFLPEVWKKINLLQSHCEERKRTPRYENERIAVAQFIIRFFKLESVFTEEDIMRVCGIVMVNGHEVPLTNPPYVAIYETASMFEHSCRANCSKSFTNEGSIFITSGESISKGDHLSICYTDPLWGTPNRRHHLNETKFFWCSCSRCLDATEFGTYFSAIKCQDPNCRGYLLPKTFIENIKHDKAADWFCKRCEKSLSTYSVQDLLERTGRDLAEMEKGNSQICKDFLKNYESFFAPNHFYLTDVKIALSQIIGQEFEGGLPAISDEDLELKARLCQSLASLFKTLIPAETRVRGLVLFELHACVTELGRRRGDPEELKAALIESKKLLTEAAELLQNVPDVLPEGRIYRQAKQNLKDMDMVLLTVQNTFGDSPV